MNKVELIAKIARKMNLEMDATQKTAAMALKAITEAITESLQEGERVQITGFGTFEVSKRAARTGVNPKTLEEIKIEAKKVPKFKAGSALKEAVEASK